MHASQGKRAILTWQLSHSIQSVTLVAMIDITSILILPKVPPGAPPPPKHTPALPPPPPLSPGGDPFDLKVAGQHDKGHMYRDRTSPYSALGHSASTRACSEVLFVRICHG